MKKQVLVSIADSHLGRIPNVVDELEREGLEVQRTMPALGVVTGTAEQEQLASLNAIDGVDAVEEQRSVDAISAEDPQ